MKQIRKFALGAISACVVAMTPAVSQAKEIQLGFILDESGSISAANWTLITGGLATAIGLIPVTGADHYWLSVTTFDTLSHAHINNVLLSSAAVRTAQAGIVAAMVQGGQSTNYQSAFAGMDIALGNSNNYDASYVNFATDGEPNTCGLTAGTVTNPGLAASEACAATAQAALIASGVDNISIEGLGVSAPQAAFLQSASVCYPQPCSILPSVNFPTQGFYVGVATAGDYSAAIQNKVKIVTNQIPEPGTIALAGLALVGLGMSRRRKL